MKTELIDENGSVLNLEYSMSVEGSFYGVSVTLNGKEHAGATFLSDRQEAQKLCETLCAAGVTPAAFFDVIKDYMS